MKHLLLIMLLLPTFSQAQPFLLEGAATASFTSSSLSETSNSTSIKHSSSMIDPGLGFEGRIGINLPFVSVGVLGLIDWESSLIKYQPVNQSILASSSYSNTRRRFAYGPTVIWHIPGGYRVAGEYLINVRDDFTYANPKSANPFADNDFLKGSGWGIGIGHDFFVFFIKGTYRQFTFNKSKMRGISSDLPNSTFSKFDTAGMFLSFGMSLK